MELLLLLAACLVLVLSSLHLVGLLANGRGSLPPGPRPLPLVGDLLCLGALPHRSLARLAERHGPVMALRLGSVTTVVASSADAARPRLPPAPRRRLLRALPPGRHPRVRALHALHGLAPGEQPPLARAAQGLLRRALRAAPPRRRRAPVPPPGQGAAARLPRRAAGARGRAGPSASAAWPSPPRSTCSPAPSSPPTSRTSTAAPPRLQLASSRNCSPS
ncbi:hypothetical protein ACP70R_018608 [Stipagrostis hirtigluma subsp. patula]